MGRYPAQCGYKFFKIPVFTRQISHWKHILSIVFPDAKGLPYSSSLPNVQIQITMITYHSFFQFEIVLHEVTNQNSSQFSNTNVSLEITGVLWEAAYVLCVLISSYKISRRYWKGTKTSVLAWTGPSNNFKTCIV